MQTEKHKVVALFQRSIVTPLGEKGLLESQYPNNPSISQAMNPSSLHLLVTCCSLTTNSFSEPIISQLSLKATWITYSTGKEYTSYVKCL